jgi:hypothetical protein
MASRPSQWAGIDRNWQWMFFRSDKTVSTYKGRIQEKLGLSSLAALIEFASLHKLVD